MERTIAWSLYTAAFVIAAIVFIAGVYVGTLLDKSDIQVLSREVESLSQDLTTMQLLFLIDDNSSAFCPLYESELSSIEEKREKLGYELTFLEEKRKIDAPELKKQYFILEAQSYFLSKKLKESCNDKTALVLYFYSNKNCTDCGRQGVDILSARDALAAQNIKIRIYSFDGEIGSQVAEGFVRQFAVSQYPTTVINGNVHSGYISKDELIAELLK